MRPIRIVFLGTAELACCSLRALAESPEVDVIGVISQPDKTKGRQLRLVPTAVKETALEFSLPVWQPDRLRKDVELISRLATLDLDVIVVAAYGQILPDSVLSIPKFGCINVHTSLLPKYRGAAPIHWAILNGDEETGITLMKMDQGLDTGEIITQQTTKILPNETSGQLHDRLAALGAAFLLESIRPYVSGSFTLQKQNSKEATHARKLAKEDARIDWAKDSATILNQIRGLNPWPGTMSYLSRGDELRMIKFWSAQPGSQATHPKPGNVISVSQQGIEIACGKGSIIITMLQREGAKRLESGPFLAGFPIQINEIFASSTPSES
jgi:methionyl-tRNA formyltransferase